MSGTAAVRICDCFKCGQAIYAGLVHHCPTALPLRDLSPLGGGPNPWGRAASAVSAGADTGEEQT